MSESATSFAWGVTRCLATARSSASRTFRICSRICTRCRRNRGRREMKTAAKSELFRALPAVDELLRTTPISALAEVHGATAVTDAVRAVTARLREEISNGLLDASSLQIALDGLAGAVEAQLRKSLSHSLRPVINATGVILHTNLGRAPLATTALDRIRETAHIYSNLEFNLESGERGKRDVHVD